MITKKEKLMWKLYKIKKELLFLYGIKNGLIQLYDEDTLNNLRHIYYGGIPATILLLDEHYANGHCYDRGTLVTLGFGDDDFNVVHANIDGIKLNPEHIEKLRNKNKNEMYADHCFAERIKKDGTVWVYDTSLGLVFEKNLYYKLEKPEIRNKRDKQTTLEFLKEDFIRDSNIEQDKYVLPLILPLMEKNLVATQPFYSEQLQEEFEILKEELNYDGICKEIRIDMQQKKY